MSDGFCSAAFEEEEKKQSQKQNLSSSIKLDNLPACFSFTAAASRTSPSASTSKDGQPVLSSAESSSAPPLVLLFAWMLAKEAHLVKYRTFWTNRGYDVITVQTGPLDTLLPTFFAARNARRLIDFLGGDASASQNDHSETIGSFSSPRYSKVLFHSLSVGNYIAMEVLYQLKLAAEKRSAAAVHSSIAGIVMDSITFLEDSAAGIARSLTASWPLQLAIRSIINGYYALTAPFTWCHFQRVIPHFTENPTRLPTLVLYSLDDPLSDWRRIKAAIEGWKVKGISVHERCWQQSQHVLHYKLHPKEYTEAVEEFLVKGIGEGKRRKDGDNGVVSNGGVYK